MRYEARGRGPRQAPRRVPRQRDAADRGGDGLRGLLRQRVDPLSPADAVPGDRARRVRRRSSARSGCPAAHVAPPAQHARRVDAERRPGARPPAADVQRRRRDRDLPARRPSRTTSTATARATRSSSSIEGAGVLETTFGSLPYRAARLRRDPARDDLPVRARGRAAVADASTRPARSRPQPLPQPLRPAARARAVLAPRLPSAGRARDPPRPGEYELVVRVRGGYQHYALDYHPLDVVGWDGYVYPYTFNIDDFEPITGRFHMPPPVHQTFQGPNFVICSFCPRMLDWESDPTHPRSRSPTTTRTSSPRR